MNGGAIDFLSISNYLPLRKHPRILNNYLEMLQRESYEKKEKMR